MNGQFGLICLISFFSLSYGYFSSRSCTHAQYTCKHRLKGVKKTMSNAVAFTTPKQVSDLCDMRDVIDDCHKMLSDCPDRDIKLITDVLHSYTLYICDADVADVYETLACLSSPGLEPFLKFCFNKYSEGRLSDCSGILQVGGLPEFCIDKALQYYSHNCKGQAMVASKNVIKSTLQPVFKYCESLYATKKQRRYHG